MPTRVGDGQWWFFELLRLLLLSLDNDMAASVESTEAAIPIRGRARLATDGYCLGLAVHEA